jgi:hypothetical protein
MKLSTITAVIFLFLVSVAHLLRLIFQVNMSLNSSEIPMWMSLAAFIFTGALGTWLWIYNRNRAA